MAYVRSVCAAPLVKQFGADYLSAWHPRGARTGRDDSVKAEIITCSGVIGMHAIAYRLLLLVGYHYDTTHEAGGETDI